MLRINPFSFLMAKATSIAKTNFSFDSSSYNDILEICHNEFNLKLTSEQIHAILNSMSERDLKKLKNIIGKLIGE